MNTELVRELIMAESETSMSDLMDNLDLVTTYDTGCEEDIELEIIDGFYPRNVAFMNERIQMFADYWMKLYSNCCLQRDYAVESLNNEKPDKAKAFLQDWPSKDWSTKNSTTIFQNPCRTKAIETFIGFDRM